MYQDPSYYPPPPPPMVPYGALPPQPAPPPGQYMYPPIPPGPANPYVYPAPAPGYMAGPPPPPTGPYAMQGFPQGPPPVEGPPIPSMDADHPDLYVPEPVRAFLPYFYRMMMEKNIPEILNIYENEFNKLGERYFVEFPWPDAEIISPLVQGDETFLLLYKELRYRHIYAKHKPTLEQRFQSYENYTDLFGYLLNTEEPIEIELPNQWLWDIVDEFIYQFQAFVQFRGKLKLRTSEEIQTLKENPTVWSVHSILNVLLSLVEKSHINEQLEAYYSGEDPASVAGDFGSHSLYKNLGYFSLIGLLRLHCQLGDYHQALEAVTNVQLSKKVLATTRVPASQISLHYYVGFSFLMMRRYRDTIRIFSNIIVFIQRARQHFQPKSYQYDMVLKQNEQMLSILAMVLTLCPQHVDEVVNSQLRERFSDKMSRLQKGELKMFEELFTYASPKFISPIPPDYDSLPENYNKEPARYQCSVFMTEMEQQLILPVIRSYLKFYTTMPIAKLAAFMDVKEAALREQLLRFKHKTHSVVSTSKGTQHLVGEVQSASDLDFYIDGDMIHIADTKMARRYGDFFIRQIHKLEEISGGK